MGLIGEAQATRLRGPTDISRLSKASIESTVPVTFRMIWRVRTEKLVRNH